jgi:hypothetical protein
LGRFRRAPAESAKRGFLRGRGIATYIEASASGGFAPFDQAHITWEKDGTITLRTASHNHGQGHETTLAQVVSRVLGVPIEKMRLRTSEPDFFMVANPTGGSRTLLGIGSAMYNAAHEIVKNGIPLAADYAGERRADIEFVAGEYRIKGTDRSVSITALAQQHPGKLDLDYRDRPKVPSTYPNGCHICELEIEPETGDIEIASYVAVDDAGTIINHQIVEGTDAGRHHARRRAHLRRGGGVRPRDRAAADRQLHGLPDAARGPRQQPARDGPPGADEDESARREGRGRSRRHRLDALRHERGHRCAEAGWRDALRHAGDAAAAVGGDPRGERRKTARVCGRAVALSAERRLSCFYFAYFAHLGAFVAYFSLWLQARGYSPSEIAAVLAVPALLRIAAPALWGWFADSIAARLRGGQPAFVALLSALAAGELRDAHAGERSACGYFGWVALTALFTAGVLPLVDAMALAALSAQPGRYGPVRLWGSIGFTASVLAAGRVARSGAGHRAASAGRRADALRGVLRARTAARARRIASCGSEGARCRSCARPRVAAFFRRGLLHDGCARARCTRSTRSTWSRPDTR